MKMMNFSNWEMFVFVFFSSILLDFLWAKAIEAIGEGNPIRAATWGSITTLLLSTITISYVDNHWLLVPLLIGGWIGVYTSVKFRKKNG